MFASSLSFRENLLCLLTGLVLGLTLSPVLTHPPYLLVPYSVIHPDFVLCSLFILHPSPIPTHPHTFSAVLTHLYLLHPSTPVLTLSLPASLVFTHPHPSTSVHVRPRPSFVPNCPIIVLRFHPSWYFSAAVLHGPFLHTPRPCSPMLTRAHQCSPVLNRPTCLSSAFSAGVHGAAQPAAGLLHPHPPVQRAAGLRFQHRGGESTAGVPAGVQRHARRTAGAQHR